MCDQVAHAIKMSSLLSTAKVLGRVMLYSRNGFIEHSWKIIHFVVRLNFLLNTFQHEAFCQFLLFHCPCEVCPDWAIYWTLGNFHRHLAIFFWSHWLSLRRPPDASVNYVKLWQTKVHFAVLVFTYVRNYALNGSWLNNWGSSNFLRVGKFFRDQAEGQEGLSLSLKMLPWDVDIWVLSEDCFCCKKTFIFFAHSNFTPERHKINVG